LQLEKSYRAIFKFFTDNAVRMKAKALLLEIDGLFQIINA